MFFLQSLLAGIRFIPCRTLLWSEDGFSLQHRNDTSGGALQSWFSQGTRDRRDCNKLCRLAFPKPWWCLDKSFGISISLSIFFSSFLFLFSFLRHVAKLKASSVQMPSALHYQSFPNDSSGNHKPQILHNSHGLFLPCKMDTADFHNQFPSLEMKQHKNEKVRFLSNSLSMSDQGKASGGIRVEQPPNCSSEQH